MFERFSADAKRVVLDSLAAAQRLGAEHVEPEHLLLGLAGGCGTPAARAIAEAGIDADAIGAAIEADLVAMLGVVGVPASLVGAVPAAPSAERPGFGVHGKAALERALREASRRGERRIVTEHMLLGALHAPSPTLTRVLARLDVDPGRLAALVEVEAAAARR
jgi:ATP-dependent Clp protease ATP-binding subunit ClpA